jgi:hypothetical protein
MMRPNYKYQNSIDNINKLNYLRKRTCAAFEASK